MEQYLVDPRSRSATESGADFTNWGRFPTTERTRIAARLRIPPGPLAQLAEQGTLNPKVEGSSPSRPIGVGKSAPASRARRLSAASCGLPSPRHIADKTARRCEHAAHGLACDDSARRGCSPAGADRGPAHDRGAAARLPQPRDSLEALRYDLTPTGPTTSSSTSTSRRSTRRPGGSASAAACASRWS